MHTRIVESICLWPAILGHVVYQSVVHIPSNTSLELADSSLPRRHQLQIASWLRVGHCFHALFSRLWLFSALQLCRSYGCCHRHGCHISFPLCLHDACSLKSFTISVSQSFSTSFSIWVPEPLGGVFDGDTPFNTYTVNFLTFCTLYHCKLLSKLRPTERSFSNEGALIYGYSDISLGVIILLCSFSKTIGVIFPLVCKLSGLFILRVNKYTFSKDFHY